MRPGGVIAFITSKGTLDKRSSEVRKYIAQRADLLGAVRLPNNAFRANAGTEVTSDIIFLQKREQPLITEPDWVHLGITEDGLPINSYFVENPHMVLGQMKWDNRMYGNQQETTCEPTDGAELSEQLSQAMRHIQGEFLEASLPELGNEVTADSSLPADPDVKNFSYTIVNGEVYYRENSRMIMPDLNATAKERVRSLVEMRNCVHELINQQMNGAENSEIRETQLRLNELYDDFTKKHGIINSRGNALAFSEDSSYYLLCSLEILDENGELSAKADMFTKRTIRPAKAVDHVDTASEALALSISEKAQVDMGYMAQLSGKTEEELASDLRGVIFPLPSSSSDEKQMYVAADEYLSGNIRTKLGVARQAAETSALYRDNVVALEKAMPKDLDASEIEVRLGTTWIHPSYIQSFMKEVLALPSYLQRAVTVNYTKATAEWRIQNKSRIAYNDISAFTTYGTNAASAYEILEESLNLRDVRIYMTIRDEAGNEKRVIDKKATMLAQQKQQSLKDAFQDWIWKDPDRRQELTEQYNILFNSVRPREYSGEHITLSGINPEFSLRQHQQDAVAHIIYGQNVLLAHEVGAGKTFEMIAACMESKRLGLCNKTLIAVPNHLTEQWATEFLRLYPSANILVTTKKDFEKSNRKKFCARITTGDYDAIIMGHSQFERIPISLKRQKQLLNEQIDEIEEGIQELKDSGAERYTVKQLERVRKQLFMKLEKLAANERKDDVITFEQLGIDRLYVDEAHSYKNLFLYTKMRNIAGLSTSDAQKSSDMYLKCRYMDETTNGKGVVFATGTPVSNSMTELYTMMRYLQHDTLNEKRLSHFDCWASTFGETTAAIELAPEGTGYRVRTRFSKFFNLPELMAQFKEVADIKVADQLNLPVPEAIFHNVVTKPSDIQKAMVQELSERAAAVHNGMDSRIDNMLKITSDGRKLGLDQRIINPLLPDDPESKTNQCVENVARIWQEGSTDKLAQLVFCDISTPKGDGSFTIYEDIQKKLIARGIPSEEIAFIHDANTEARKKELFAKVRSGQVRVLLGSTAKMGAGTNVQDRLVALHDLDCPWRPGDLEQRKGRIVRQGNKNAQVHIYRYVTEGTFDSYLWQTVENKQRFISQIMTSKSPVRSCDDIDEVALSYAAVKALCAGDPNIKEKMDLDMDVAKLRVLKSAHQSQQFRMENAVLKYFPKSIAQAKETIVGIERDLVLRNAFPLPEEGFIGMEVHGVHYTEKEAAGKAIIEACTKVKDMESVELGKYRGFNMTLSVQNFGKEFVLCLQSTRTYSITLGADPRGNILRIDNALAAMEEKLRATHTELENLEQQKAAAQLEIGKPFPQESELSEKSTRLAALDALLNMSDKDNQQVLEDSDDEEPVAKVSVLAELKKAAEEIQPPTQKEPYREQVAR